MNQLVGLDIDGNNIKTNFNLKNVDWTHLAQDTFQYLVHVNLKSRGFLDRLSQACDEEHFQDTCKRQLSGTNGGLVSCLLYRMGGYADNYSQYVSSRTT